MDDPFAQYLNPPEEAGRTNVGGGRSQQAQSVSPPAEDDVSALLAKFLEPSGDVDAKVMKWTWTGDGSEWMTSLGIVCAEMNGIGRKATTPEGMALAVHNCVLGPNELKFLAFALRGTLELYMSIAADTLAAVLERVTPEDLTRAVLRFIKRSDRREAYIGFAKYIAKGVFTAKSTGGRYDTSDVVAAALILFRIREFADDETIAFIEASFASIRSDTIVFSEEPEVVATVYASGDPLAAEMYSAASRSRTGKDDKDEDVASSSSATDGSTLGSEVEETQTTQSSAAHSISVTSVNNIHVGGRDGLPPFSEIVKSALASGIDLALSGLLTLHPDYNEAAATTAVSIYEASLFGLLEFFSGISMHYADITTSSVTLALSGILQDDGSEEFAVAAARLAYFNVARLVAIRLRNLHAHHLNNLTQADTLELVKSSQALVGSINASILPDGVKDDAPIPKSLTDQNMASTIAELAAENTFIANAPGYEFIVESMSRLETEAFGVLRNRNSRRTASEVTREYTMACQALVVFLAAHVYDLHTRALLKAGSS
jgi:hypothetical protein